MSAAKAMVVDGDNFMQKILAVALGDSYQNIPVGSGEDAIATQRKSLMDQRIAFSNLTDQMENALTSVALTESQEEFLSSIIRNGIENIINSQSAGLDLQNKLTTIAGELKEMLNTPNNAWSR